MKVAYFDRHPLPGAYSIENLFHTIRLALPRDIAYSVHVARNPSKGFFPRFKNAIEAVRQQSEVNHVTGEVHYLATFLEKSRTVVTMHDCVMLERLHGLKKAVLFFFWYWLPAKRCRTITVVSESTKREVMRHLKCTPGKIRVVPNCVSPVFKHHPKPFNRICPRILQVGTGPNKNLPRVAAAIEGLGCHLRVIGRLSSAQKQVLDHHRINYSAEEHLTALEVVRNYQECDLIVFASTYEGFGLPIVEANAVGRPVVTSNILSMPEVAGDAACLVNPFDPISIRAGVEKIIENSNYRRHLVEAGLRNKHRFRPQTVASAYVDIYRAVLDATAGSDAY